MSPPPLSLTALGKPGAPRWTPLTTRGQRGFGNDAYVIDTVTVPYDNPWKALFFTAGVDFLPNGDAAVCTIHGDVWLVSGIDDGLQKITWRRFATGLFQPLGLRSAAKAAARPKRKGGRSSTGWGWERAASTILSSSPAVNSNASRSRAPS